MGFIFSKPICFVGTKLRQIKRSIRSEIKRKKENVNNKVMDIRNNVVGKATFVHNQVVQTKESCYAFAHHTKEAALAKVINSKNQVISAYIGTKETIEGKYNDTRDYFFSKKNYCFAKVNGAKTCVVNKYTSTREYFCKRYLLAKNLVVNRYLTIRNAKLNKKQKTLVAFLLLLLFVIFVVSTSMLLDYYNEDYDSLNYKLDKLKAGAIAAGHGFLHLLYLLWLAFLYILFYIWKAALLTLERSTLALKWTVYFLWVSAKYFTFVCWTVVCETLFYVWVGVKWITSYSWIGVKLASYYGWECTKYGCYHGAVTLQYCCVQGLKGSWYLLTNFREASYYGCIYGWQGLKSGTHQTYIWTIEGTKLVYSASVYSMTYLWFGLSTTIIFLKDLAIHTAANIIYVGTNVKEVSTNAGQAFYTGTKTAVMAVREGVGSFMEFSMQSLLATSRAMYDWGLWTGKFLSVWLYKLVVDGSGAAYYVINRFILRFVYIFLQWLLHWLLIIGNILVQFFYNMLVHVATFVHLFVTQLFGLINTVVSIIRLIVLSAMGVVRGVLLSLVVVVQFVFSGIIWVLECVSGVYLYFLRWYNRYREFIFLTFFGVGGLYCSGFLSEDDVDVDDEEEIEEERDLKLQYAAKSDDHQDGDELPHPLLPSHTDDLEDSDLDLPSDQEVPDFFDDLSSVEGDNGPPNQLPEIEEEKEVDNDDLSELDFEPSDLDPAELLKSEKEP